MKNLNKKHIKLFFIILLLLLIAIIILPVSIPLILAFITASILNPIVRWFIRKLKINRKLAVTIVFILFIIVISTIGSYAVTKIIGQVINFAENVPSYIIHLNNQLLEWESDLDHFTEDLPSELVEEVKAQIQSTTTALSNNIREMLRIEEIAKVASKVPDYLVSFIVYLIALFMLMLELPRLKAKAYSHLKDSTADKVKFMNDRLSYVILGFFKAQFLVSIIIFIVTLIGLYIIVPEYALIMSLIIWIIDFIPIIGSIAILGPWSLYMLITGDLFIGGQLAILAIILLAIRRIVEPKVMGKHIGLSPLATLIAMYIGLKLLGILGFIVGPLLVIAFNSAKEAGIIKMNFKI
ncbi:sporulation integral membrane protein YtvI [Gracilibacillus salitolerans]|uniref:Sporulation integral membrane protein YtvI n=1 Tax=Gracilibacillus salitolerans TaxID=2663022 RepID=A0A5Q2TJT7_9BACI|nr:sporulation integral membrane protein YtvI [Gracilibacillus salitolerans]QGH34401.1 sporulation integral membrane protein YtvI [Gracilibacillus salitolerans]